MPEFLMASPILLKKQTKIDFRLGLVIQIVLDISIIGNIIQQRWKNEENLLKSTQ